MDRESLADTVLLSYTGVSFFVFTHIFKTAR